MKWRQIAALLAVPLLLGASFEAGSPTSVGLSSMVDNEIVKGNGTTGVQASGVVVEDDGSIHDAGGNARGSNTFDFQMLRDNADEVCQARSSFIQGESNQIDGVDSQYGDGAHSIVMGNYNTVTDSGNVSSYGGTFSTIIGSDSCEVDGAYNGMILNSYDGGGQPGGCTIWADGDTQVMNVLFNTTDSEIGESNSQGAGSYNMILNAASSEILAGVSESFIIGSDSSVDNSYSAVIGSDVSNEAAGTFIFNRPNSSSISSWSGANEFAILNYSEVCIDPSTSSDSSCAAGNQPFYLSTSVVDLGDATVDVNLRGSVRTAAQTVSVADNLTPASQPSTATVPTSYSIRYTCNDSDGCDETISESGASDGQLHCLTNISSNVVDIVYNDGVVNIPGGADVTLQQWETACFTYITDRWVVTNVEN